MANLLWASAQAYFVGNWMTVFKTSPFFPLLLKERVGMR